jgi:preprotein translocase subunit SecY
LTKGSAQDHASGCLFLGFVAILPFLLSLLMGALGVGIGGQSSVLLVNSAGLLIVVGVVRDTFFNIDAELKLHGYDDTLLVR